MIRISDIQKAFRTLVGWRAETPFMAESTESESGLTYQDAHPLATVANVSAAMPEGADLTACLAELQDNAASAVVQRFIEEKQLAKETRTLLDRGTLFDGNGRRSATVRKAGRLVGMEFDIRRSLGVTLKINSIGLQVTGATGVVKLHVMHSALQSPYRTIELDCTQGNGGFQWFAVKDLYLPSVLSTGETGKWYLCYDEEQMPLEMEAIGAGKDFSREPCGTCNRGNLQRWREMVQHVEVSPFAVTNPSKDEEGNPEMWAEDATIYTPMQNYGLNVELTIGCDLTDFIIQQRQSFASVLQKQLAYTALRTMYLNPSVRVNRNQSNVNRADILYELDGDATGRRTGLGYELERAYKALAVSTRGLDPVCLGCNNRGVNYRTIL